MKLSLHLREVILQFLTWYICICFYSRSDTIAATPVKTLRSRNVDITGHTISPQLVHQYGIVKQSRLSLPCKLKHSSNNGFLQSNRVRSSSLSSSIKQTSSNTANGACSTISPTNTGCNSSSGMAKRVKSPYNPSARSLSTRSRIKRLGKWGRVTYINYTACYIKQGIISYPHQIFLHFASCFSSSWKGISNWERLTILVYTVAFYLETWRCYRQALVSIFQMSRWNWVWEFYGPIVKKSKEK